MELEKIIVWQRRSIWFMRIEWYKWRNGMKLILHHLKKKIILYFPMKKIQSWSWIRKVVKWYSGYKMGFGLWIPMNVHQVRNWVSQGHIQITTCIVSPILWKQDGEISILRIWIAKFRKLNVIGMELQFIEVTVIPMWEFMNIFCIPWRMRVHWLKICIFSHMVQLEICQELVTNWFWTQN